MMDLLNAIEKLEDVIVCEEAELIVIKSMDGVKLFTTSAEVRVGWFNSTKSVTVRSESTGFHVLTLIETSKQLRSEKSVEIRDPSDSKLIGSAVMKKRFFWTSHEIRGETGQKIAGFACDGEKYVFDGGVGTAKQDKKQKGVSFTIHFADSLDKKTKLLMTCSAFLMITIEKEAQEALSFMLLQ